MERREHILHFFGNLLLCVVAFVVYWGLFALIIRVANYVKGYIDDAKKWRDWQFWENRIRESEKRERGELENQIEELEEDNKQLKNWINDQQELIDGMKISISLYEEFTGILEFEIGDYLEEQRKKDGVKKRSKRKKRK